MKLQEIITVSRLVLPTAQETKVTDANLTFLANEASKSIALKGKLRRVSKSFNLVTTSNEYIVTDIDSDFLNTDSSGLWRYDGSNFTKLYRTTIENMDYDFRSWRDNSAGTAQKYFIQDNTIFLDRTAATAVTNGLKLYYIKKYSDMIDNEHYPFHKDGAQNVELNQYSDLCWSIIDFIEWQISKALGKDEVVIAKQQIYETNLKNRLTEIGIEPDLENSEYLEDFGNDWYDTQY